MMIVKKSLPLPDHAENKIVDDNDFNINVVVGDCRKLLNIHHNRAVAREQHDIFLGTSQLRAHSGGQSEAHSSEPARSQKLSRLVRFEKLRRPHLMLSNVRDDDCIFIADTADFADKCPRFNRVAFFFPIKRMLQTFFDGLSFPCRKFFGKIRKRLVQFIFEKRK